MNNKGDCGKNLNKTDRPKRFG